MTDLLIDLMQLGIHLEAHDGRLRYYPRSAVTRELAGRMKLHKAELIASLGSQGLEADAPKERRAQCSEALSHERILVAVLGTSKMRSSRRLDLPCKPA